MRLSSRENLLGEELLHRKDPALQTTKIVERAVGGKDLISPPERISAWLSVLEKTHLGHRDEPKIFDKIKNYYHRKFITISADNIPQSYWNNKAEFMIRNGQGDDLWSRGVTRRTIGDEDDDDKKRYDYVFPRAYQEEEVNKIRSNQEASLDLWLDYLSSTEGVDYPMWARYWVFTSILKMGSFEKTDESHYDQSVPVGGMAQKRRIRAGFQRRGKSTVSAFPVLNSRALAEAISTMRSYLEDKERLRRGRELKAGSKRGVGIIPESQIINRSKQLTQEEFERLVRGEKFADLYAQFLLEIPEYSTEGLEEIRGEWKKYPRQSEPDELVNSLKGFPLEWCTAEIDTARHQLEGGDFYVYYSLDSEGRPVVPRLAIRMDGQRIAEPPRGIAARQNLDPFIGPVLEKKLKEFGTEGRKFHKRLTDTEQLNEICDTVERGEELSIEKLIFLYEIDHVIEGFGHERDKRIAEILARRSEKDDLEKIFGGPINQEQIIIGRCRDFSKPTKICLGGIHEEAERGSSGGETFVFPERVCGNFKMEHFKLSSLPKHVSGDFYLYQDEIDGIDFPEAVGGDFKLISGDIRNSNFPRKIGGNMELSPDSINNTKLPLEVGGNFEIGLGLEDWDSLILPSVVGGDARLRRLRVINGLVLPQVIEGDLYLNSSTRGLVDALVSETGGLVLPSRVGGEVKFDKKISDENLERIQKRFPGLRITKQN